MALGDETSDPDPGWKSASDATDAAKNAHKRIVKGGGIESGKSAVSKSLSVVCVCD